MGTPHARRRNWESMAGIFIPPGPATRPPSAKRAWADAEGEEDPEGVLHGVPEDTTVVGNPLLGVPAEGEQPSPSSHGPTGDEIPRLPCGAVAGPAQCMCLICMGGEDTGDASTIVDDPQGGDDDMGEEDDL